MCIPDFPISFENVTYFISQNNLGGINQKEILDRAEESRVDKMISEHEIPFVFQDHTSLFVKQFKTDPKHRKIRNQVFYGY